MTNRARFCRLLGATAFAAVAGLPLTADARKRRGKSKKRRPATKKGSPSQLPNVQKVGNGAITVNGKYYEVSRDAHITVNGKKANLGKIKPGMQASVSGSVLAYGKTSKDTIYQATRITARTNKPMNTGNSGKKKKK